MVLSSGQRLISCYYFSRTTFQVGGEISGGKAVLTLFGVHFILDLLLDGHDLYKPFCKISSCIYYIYCFQYRK